MNTTTKKILNPNFSEFSAWPFANLLPEKNHFAFPLDHIFSGSGTNEDFYYIQYIEIRHHDSVMPSYLLHTITKVGDYPEVHNCIHVSSNSRFRNMLEKLTAIVDIMEKIGPMTTEQELKSVLSGEGEED